MDAGLISIQVLLVGCVCWGGYLACAGMSHTRDAFRDDDKDGHP